MPSRKKAQSALEYLMTYGWVILIIAIVVVIIYSMGILNPSSSIPTVVTGFSGFNVQGSCIQGGALQLQVINDLNHIVNITKENTTGTNGQLISMPINMVMSPGESQSFFVPGACPKNVGTTFSNSVTLTYTEPGQVFYGPYHSNGDVSGKTIKFLQSNVAYFVNSSYVEVPYSSLSTSMKNMWDGGHTYSIVYWVKAKQVYPSCESFQTPASNSCDGAVEETNGCVAGSYKYPYNSTFFSVYGYEWNGTNGCGDDANSYSSLSAYAEYNKWYMVTFTFDFISPTDAVFNICVDSQCRQNVNSMTQPDTYTDEELLIFGTYQVIGAAANVQIYNLTLSQSQISQLYSEGISGAPTQINGLIGWWPLDGNAKDYSGNNNNGIPINITWIPP